MEEEYNLNYDLGSFLDFFLRQWQLILAMTLIAGIAALITSQQQPIKYQASVLLASTKSTLTVSYEPSIQTLTEEQQLISKAVSNARLKSYVHLVRNPVIAREVLDKMGDQLDKQDRSVEKLLKLVKGKLISGSDSSERSVPY